MKIPTFTAIALLASVTMASGQTAAVPGQVETDLPCGRLEIRDCISQSPETARRQLEIDGEPAPTSSPRLLGELYDAQSDFRDPVRARAYYEQAVGDGDDWARLSFGRLLAAGEASEDIDLAIEVFEAATIDGVRKWTLKDAGDLRTRRGGEQDRDIAHRNYAQAVELGNFWAIGPLVSALSRGDRISVDEEYLQAQIEKAVAENPEYGESGRSALAYLARHMSLEGDADQKARGFQLLESAAEGGVPFAQVEIAKVKASRGRPSETIEAISLFEKAAAADPALGAVAYHSIGEIYNSRPLAVDRRRAIEYYEKGSAAGNSWSSYRLARAYINGDEVVASARKARRYADAAFEQGNAKAGLAALFSFYGTRHDLSAEELVSFVRKGLQSSNPSEIAEGLSWTPMNSRVRFAQEVWREQGLYSGPVSGVMNGRTFDVFTDVCRRNRVAACRQGIMPRELMTLIVQSLV